MIASLYPHLETSEQVQALADRIGVVPNALNAEARRAGLTRAQRPSPHVFSGDDDALLRRIMSEASDPVDGIQQAADRLGATRQAVAGRWRKLQRRRRAGVGDWTEQELDQAVKHGVVAGRNRDETSLRLLTLGVRSVEDRLVTLRELAGRGGWDLLDIQQEVVSGRLQAAKPRQASALADGDWVTTERRIGAWLVACPDRAGDCADRPWAMLLVFSAGVKVGEALSKPTAA